MAVVGGAGAAEGRGVADGAAVGLVVALGVTAVVAVAAGRAVLEGVSVPWGVTVLALVVAAEGPSSGASQKRTTKPATNTAATAATPASGDQWAGASSKIGRASCRERV